jgi:hypothetical protein
MPLYDALIIFCRQWELLKTIAGLFVMVFVLYVNYCDL